jgi:hypothetical protein
LVTQLLGLGRGRAGPIITIGIEGYNFYEIYQQKTPDIIMQKFDDSYNTTMNPAFYLFNKGLNYFFESIDAK